MKCIAPIERERRTCPYTGDPLSESPNALCSVDPDIKKLEALPCVAGALFAKVLAASSSTAGTSESLLTPLDDPSVQKVTRTCARIWGSRITLREDRRARNI